MTPLGLTLTRQTRVSVTYARTGTGDDVTVWQWAVMGCDHEFPPYRTL